MVSAVCFRKRVIRLGPGQRSRPLAILYDGGDVEVSQVRVSCEERGQRDCPKGMCPAGRGAHPPRLWAHTPRLTSLIQEDVIGLHVSVERAGSREMSPKIPAGLGVPTSWVLRPPPHLAAPWQS